MPASTPVLASALELTLIFVGLVLLWRHALSPAARAARVAPTLPTWEGALSDFLLFLWLVIAGGVVLPLIAQPLARLTPLGETGRIMVVNAAFQLGMLGGALGYTRTFGRHQVRIPLGLRTSLLPGLTTFLVSLPLIVLVGLFWLGVMKLIGLPPDRQDLVRIFTETKSPAMLIFMIVLATVLAPVTEELVFRAGMFRFARTRLPRWAALLLPACFFAALHNHFATFAPLVVLGIVFSLAYERTGSIATSMIAHGLFNAYSVLRIFINPDAT
jgi:hypothetical protein